MNYTRLSIDQAPDFWAPLRFFISAPLFAIAAVVLLLFSGPDILQNRWLPETLAVTHLLSLGFITMVMMGALFQLLPVLAGSSIYKSEKSSKVIHFFMVCGIVFFCTGFVLSDFLLLKVAVFFLLPGILIFLVLVSLALIKTKSTFASAKGMSFSIIALWFTLLSGGWLVIGTAWDSVPLLRQFTQVHILWAALGWVMVMVVAIAYQVIPMFQVTQEYPARFKQFFILFLFIGLIILSIQMVSGDAQTAIVLILSVMLFVFSTISIRLLWQRKKRMIDASGYYWFTGLLALIVCIVVFNYERYFQVNASVLLAFIFFFGFVMSIINGMLFKIVPFLVWLHLNKKLAFVAGGLSAVPTMNEVIRRKNVLRQYLIHSVALILGLLSFYWPGVLFYPAMVVWLLSLSFMFLLLLQAIRLYYSCLRSIQSD